MPDRDDPLIAVLSQWVQKAENDLASAVALLKLRTDRPTDAACFHAQQCVEKYIKALLVLKRLSFAKTHNIRLLMELLPEETFGLDADMQDQLTDYATVSRYPGEDEPISLAEARAALRAARLVRRAVRKQLPRAALPKRTK